MPPARARSSVLDGRIYSALDLFTRVVALNLLWLLASLPLVTLFPATAAMFAVVRQWANGDETHLLRTFVRGFTGNFRQAFALQVGVSVVVAGLYADTVLAPQFPAPARIALLAVAGVAGVLVAAALVYAFPLMAGYRLRLAAILRLSVLLAIGRPATTIRCLALGVLAGALTVVFPAAPLLVSGVVAATTHRWCARVLADLPDSTSENPATEEVTHRS